MPQIPVPLNVTNSNKNCTDEPVVKVLICTWAPPGDLMTDLKVEMDAQIFDATNGSSLSRIQFRSKILCGCDEIKWINLKIHRN